ncbi:MAG: response regulator [Oscillospiraceae bacterium]|nr:response regulator [Oscillospiraceae bacterium]
MKYIEKNNLFQASQLTILLSCTVFSVILIAEAFVMSWELWPLIPIAIGIVVSWTMHIQQRLTDKQRLWLYSAFVMFSFFYYGSHRTSVFDTVAVMALILILYTMVCIKPLITFLQIIYYLTLGYGMLMMWHDGEKFTALMISRAVMNVAVVTAISMISRTIIDKWTEVVDQSHDEIEKLTDTTDRLNDFLANVSHETRTPINAIIGLTGICIDDEENEERRRNLISVREAGRRVAEQIGDILDFTEIDRKKLINHYEDYMLSSVLNDLVEEIRPFKPKDLELVIDVDPAIPSVLNTDINKLRKILRHLIMNGLKYTYEGGVYVRLYTIPETYGVNLLIKVTDTGIGMSEDELERIFERYYQADSGRNRQGSGLGLGMTIVQGFTASLGGFITVSSEPGKGTTVTVSIPQKVVEPSSCMSILKPEKLCLGAFLHLEKYPNPNVREYYNMMIHNIVKGFGIQMHRVDHVANLKKLLASVKLTHLFIAEEEYASAPELIESLASKVITVVVANSDFELPEGSKARIMVKPFYCFPVAAVLNAEQDLDSLDERISFPGVHALVVDDEPMNLTVAQNIFRRYGMTVTTADSGAEALELCSEQCFDIIFMDHMMPGMDGIEAMKRIRSAGNYAEVPVVALTANAVSTARESFLAAGFDGFVSKPIELIDLERVLRRVLRKFIVTYQEKPEKPLAASDTGKSDSNADDTETAALRQLERCGLDTVSGLKYCAGDEAFYLSMLQEFASGLPERTEKMRNFLAENDLKNYEILVHALKSNLKMLGSDPLSERAKELEFAAKNGDAALIAEKYPPLEHDCNRLAAEILQISGCESGQDSDADEIMEFLPDDDSVTEFEPNREEQ